MTEKKHTMQPTLNSCNFHMRSPNNLNQVAAPSSRIWLHVWVKNELILDIYNLSYEIVYFELVETYKTHIITKRLLSKKTCIKQITIQPFHHRSTIHQSTFPASHIYVTITPCVFTIAFMNTLFPWNIINIRIATLLSSKPMLK